MNPLARPPLGGPPVETRGDVDSATGFDRAGAVFDELADLASALNLRRIGWGATRLLPEFTLARSRARLLSLVGCDIGRGTAVTGYVHMVGPRDCARGLHIGSGCILGPDIILGLDASITLGKNVSIGPRAVLYTATHPLGVADRRMQLDVLSRPIVVGDGAWIGMGATILPGVHVGRGAVVGAGAVVNEDVADNVLVAGNPATVVHVLSDR